MVKRIDPTMQTNAVKDTVQVLLVLLLAINGFKCEAQNGSKPENDTFEVSNF